MNLIDFFDRSASFNPHRTAVVFEGRRWRYEEVAELATRIGNGLRSLGLAKETRCAVISRNDPIAFISMLGILKAQGTWVPLSPANALEENLYMVEHFDVEVLFFLQESEAFARQVRDQLPQVRHFFCIDAQSSLGPQVEPWAEAQSAEAVRFSWEPDAVCWLRGTGGTTGRSKGVMNTNRNLETTIANCLASFRVEGRPICLASAPLSHSAGVSAMVTMAMGGTLVIARKFDAQETLRAIAEHRVSMLFLPPTALYALLSQPNVREFDYSSLRYFAYGAAPTSATKLQEAIDVFGPTMTQGYGQTEVPASVTFFAPQDHVDENGRVIERRLLSCGRPSPFARVALMDDNGSFVPQGEIGEIVVQGGLVMKGYYKDPEATAEVSKFGWHHTGDLAYQDADGFIYILDRKKEMIITGGYNVYPLEVEQVVLSLPSVQDCAVVGVPDAKWGEAIKAVIELKVGCTLDPDEVIALCKRRIGHVKAPKTVEFIDCLPRSPAGKVMRKEVRERYWTDQTRKV